MAKSTDRMLMPELGVPSRTPIHRGLRIGLITGLAAIFAYAAFAMTLEEVLAKRSHPLVALLTPNSPGMATALADTGSRFLVADQKSPITPQLIASNAKSALLSAPLNPAALRSLGIAETRLGREKNGAELVELASRLSKRDLVAQAWLFDHYMRQNRPQDGLAALDYALRVHDEVKPLLLPRLAQTAIRYPESRTFLLPYISAKNPWAAEFVSLALKEQGGAQMVASLARRVGGLPDTRLFRDMQPEVVRHLIETGAYTEAREYQRFYDRGSAKVINRVDFSDANTSQSQSAFAWRLGEIFGTYAEFSGEDPNNNLVVDVSQQQDGVLVSKVLVLEQGTYVVRAPPASTAPTHRWVQWEVECLPNGPKLAQLELGKAATFSIPRGCVGQRMSLKMLRDASSTASVYSAEVAAPTLIRR